MSADVSSLLSGQIAKKSVGAPSLCIYEVPTFCPRCRKPAVGEVHGDGEVSYNEDDGSEIYLEVPIRCPACSQLYIAHYTQYRNDYDPAFAFTGTVPRVLPPTLVSKVMKKIAPTHAVIYDQAIAAEEARLSEISGPGFRRALEALVKEYLIYKKPDQEQSYRETALRNCIKHHVDDLTIRQLADKATLVGNDLTHFTKYNDEDVQDLKDLITLVRRWIELHEETAEVRQRLGLPPLSEQAV